tara:strand:- start:482 stop:787 length:306 start_codon:yes stop_codon:yes gene_type:complete
MTASSERKTFGGRNTISYSNHKSKRKKIMSKRTIDFQIPLTNKVLAVEDGVAYVLATVLPVILIIGTFALFGTYGLLTLGSLAGGYVLYDGISIKNKDEEQ